MSSSSRPRLDMPGGEEGALLQAAPRAVSGCGVPWAGGCGTSLGSATLCFCPSRNQPASPQCLVFSVKHKRTEKSAPGKCGPFSCAWPRASAVPFPSHAAASSPCQPWKHRVHPSTATLPGEDYLEHMLNS